MNIMIALNLATLLLFSHPSHQTSSHTLSLQAFAIDYGWIPQQHNQLVAYAKLLQGYRLVILGSGDENPKNVEIPSIRELQTMLPTTVNPIIPIRQLKNGYRSGSNFTSMACCLTVRVPRMERVKQDGHGP